MTDSCNDNVSCWYKLEVSCASISNKNSLTYNLRKPANQLFAYAKKQRCRPAAQ